MQINKRKLGIWIGSSLTVLILIGSFFANYELRFRSPVNVQFHSPVRIAKREAKVITITETAKADENINPLTPDQQYGCNLFGKDCKIFLAIFRAESSLNPKAINVNKDNSVDFGCMQINSVHLKQIDTNKINLLNCRDNIDVAFKIFKQQGNFSAWSAFNNGSYKKYLIN